MCGALLVAIGLLLNEPGGDVYRRAVEKITLIQLEKAAPGSRILLTAEELNAFAAVEVKKAALQGISQPRVELGRGRATGYALVNFVKLSETTGKPVHPLLKLLFAGEYPVQATARIESARGQATVFVEEVRIGGLPARGAVLDLLIENFLLPFHPTATIGRPFELKHKIERVEVAPSAVTVVVGR